MNKTAAVRSQARRAALAKSASLATDYLATLPTAVAGQLPIVGLPVAAASLGGSIGGLVAPPRDKENPETTALSLVPGVGSFRIAQRLRRVADASNAAGRHGTANLAAEQLGSISSTLLGTGAGAALGGGLGALIGDADRLRGAGRGAAIGAGAGALASGLVAPLVGAIVAGIRRKRAKKEQIASDTTGRAVSKYLVPGLAVHDSLKRLGASTHYDVKKSDKKTKKAAEAAGTSMLARLKAIVGGATTRYSNLDPVVQKLLTTGIGAAAGAGVGSISLGHDREGRRRGYLLGGEKGRSRTTGALAGALAGLHVPIVHKAAEAAYAEGFRKAAEAMGVDPVALYKQAAPWAAISRLVGKGIGAARSLGGSAARLGQAAGAAAARTRAGQAVIGAGQRYLGLLRGGNVAQLQSKAQNLRSLAGRSSLDAMTAPSPELVAKAQGVAGRAMRQAGRAESMLAREQRAVDLARVGTAGGLGAAGLLALRGGKSGGQPQGQAGAAPTSASEMARRGWLNA